MSTKKKTSRKSKTLNRRAAEDAIEFTGDGVRLDLSLRGFTKVPMYLQQLSVSVDQLDLSRNLLKTIPNSIGVLDTLSVLDLHSNDLEELPETIRSLKALKVFNLCNNRLKSLPAELGLLTSLQVLFLGLNRLSALPASIGNLKDLRRLGLSHNFFTCIPSCLAKLEKLKTLNMDGNPLRRPETPESNTDVAEGGLVMVKWSQLCEECLNRCRTERAKMEDTEDYEASPIRPEQVLFNT